MHASVLSKHVLIKQHRWKRSPASRASEWLRKTHNIAISPEAIAAIHARRCATFHSAFFGFGKEIEQRAKHSLA